MEDDGGSEGISITFETLYDMLRREKNREDLQEMNLSFFIDVIDYLNEKQKIMDSKDPQENLFAHEDKRKTAIQIENIKRIIRDLYDIRERKIMDLARDVSRTGSSNIVNSKALLKEERQLYEQLLETFNRYRKGVLYKVLTTQKPEIDEEPKTIKREPETKQNNKQMVRFLSHVEQFMGPELITYGPFKKDDIATLPTKVVNVLTNKGSIEVINAE